MSRPKITWDTLFLGKERVHVAHVDDAASLYLLGTNHVSDYSARVARQLIRQVDPDVVAVELCRRRLEEANRFGGDPDFDERYRQLEQIPTHWRKRAAAEMMRLRLTTAAMDYCANLSPAATRSALRASPVERLERCHGFAAPKWRGYRIRPSRVRELRIAADIFAPFCDEVWYLRSNRSSVLRSPRLRYRIVMADLPIERTYAQLAAALRDQEKRQIRRYQKNFVRTFLRDRVGVMGRIWRANAKIAQVVIGQRNRYLAYRVARATRDAPTKRDAGQPVRVVGLVGRRHVAGILDIWKSDGERMRKWLTDK